MNESILKSVCRLKFHLLVEDYVWFPSEIMESNSEPCDQFIIPTVFHKLLSNVVLYSDNAEVVIYAKAYLQKKATQVCLIGIDFGTGH